MLKKLSGVDSRLNDRYRRLVSEHMNSSGGLNAGLNALPDKISSFAGIQAADELSDCICLLSRQGFAQVLVHLINREGDSGGIFCKRVKPADHHLESCQQESAKAIAKPLIDEPLTSVRWIHCSKIVNHAQYSFSIQ